MSSVRISSLFPVVCFNNSYLPGANDMSPQQSLRIVTFTDDWLLSVIYADRLKRLIVNKQVKYRKLRLLIDASIQQTS